MNQAGGAYLQACMASPHISWAEVRQHALQEADVAVTLRVALDDTNPGVVAAAATALNALIAPGPVASAEQEFVANAGMGPRH